MAKNKRKGARPSRSARTTKTRRLPASKAPKTHASPSDPRRASKSSTAHRASPTKRKSSRSVAPGAAALIRLPFFLVDAFTKRRLRGNPAAVVLLSGAWLPDEALQAIAQETGAPATAFVLERGGSGGKAGLRWFSPQIELALCGHGTLAAAHVLATQRGIAPAGNGHARMNFDTRSSGIVSVERVGEMYVLDFPAKPGEQIPLTGQLSAALGVAPTELYRAGDRLLAVFDNRRDVYAMTPDMGALAALDASGVIVTAPGASHDFVSRYFAPRMGLPEDHVTGSTHCTLIPYWAKRFGKKTLFANQVSRRGGELMCEDRGDRVRIGGHAVTVCEGTLSV